MNALNPPGGTRSDQLIVAGAFLALFPGFFFYHTLLGTGTMGAILGGYYAPVALLVTLPMAFVYLARVRRDPRRFTLIDLHFGFFMLYFLLVAGVNVASGANRAIFANHLLAILYMIQVFVMFAVIDFASPRFRLTALACLFGMTAIIMIFSVDGVFYLGALGIAKDADSLATYQGFSRSYLMTYLAVIAFTRSLSLRMVLHVLGAAALFINTARSEFVALLFVAPIIEFYYSRHKLYFILVGLIAFVLLNLYLDQIIAALPSNRILELLDLSQSTSANKRHHLTVHAVQTILAHPLLGDYGSYQPGYYSHNILSAWVDLGLFGLAYLILLLVVPVVPMFFREYFAVRRRPIFILGFALACVTLLLLATSHYFTDMLIGATLGACSRYLQERKYAKTRAPDLGPSAPRHPDLRQGMPQLGQPRP